MEHCDWLAWNGLFWRPRVGQSELDGTSRETGVAQPVVPQIIDETVDALREGRKILQRRQVT